MTDNKPVEPICVTVEQAVGHIANSNRPEVDYIAQSAIKIAFVLEALQIREGIGQETVTCPPGIARHLEEQGQDVQASWDSMRQSAIDFAGWWALDNA
jgi:hypothetical protein